MDDAILDGLSRLQNQMLEANNFEPSADFGGSVRNLSNFYWAGENKVPLLSWLKLIIGKHSRAGILMSYVRRDSILVPMDNQYIQSASSDSTPYRDTDVIRLREAVRTLPAPAQQMAIILCHGVHEEPRLDRYVIKKLAIQAGYPKREAGRMAQRMGNEVVLEKLPQQQVAMLLSVGDRQVRNLLSRAIETIKNDLRGD